MTTNSPLNTAISVLYVEDDRDARDVLLSVLQSRYPQVHFHTADNGNTGLIHFQEYRPQIVITDICMPVMGGIEMASTIKSMAPKTMFIATSAYSETSYFIKAIEIGFNHFVLKPLDYDQLFTAIDRSIEYVMLSQQVCSQQDHIIKLSRALEQSPSSIVIMDLAGNIDYLNQRYSEMTGYAPHEALGQNARFLNSELTSPAVYKKLWRTIRAGREWRGELLNRKKNGDQYWELVSISPIHDSSGVITHFVAVKEEITKRKRDEAKIRELNADLAAKAQMLETANLDLEAFNSTVSHDLRNYINTIGGFAQILLDKDCCVQKDKRLKYLENIYQQTTTMERLIETLLRFSKISFQKLKRRQVDLSNIAQEISFELRLRQPDWKTSFEIAKGLYCSGDYELLRIVMENLLGNAWKYSAKQEQAVIEFNCKSNNGETIFFVRDNGVGFDSEQSDQLFKTFTRLHNDKDFEGFGIGLATVKRIIEKHGGTTWAEGVPGQGATFFFTVHADKQKP
jgi:PAS domain S-box-containing protein